VTVWAIFLPKVEYSLYFHTKKEFTENIKLHQSNNEVAIPENAAVCWFEKLYYYNGTHCTKGGGGVSPQTCLHEQVFLQNAPHLYTLLQISLEILLTAQFRNGKTAVIGQ